MASPRDPHGAGTPDRRLAAAEGQVPGLARALDPGAIAEASQALLGLEPLGVTAVYARYKPGTSLVSTHRIDTPHGPVLVAAKAHRVADADKLRKHLDRAVRRHGPAAAGDVGDGLLLRRWPADTALPGTELLDRTRASDGDPTRGPVRAPRWVRRAIGADVDLQPVRWKPARRLVMALVDPDDRVRGTLKVTTRAGRARKGAHLLGLLAGHDAERSAVVLRWVPGTPLDEVLGTATDRAAAAELGREAGAALAALHRSPRPSSLRVLDPVPALREAAAGAVDLLPDLGERITYLVDAVAARLPRGATAILHGDASVDQMVVGGDGGVRLIDADEIGIGEAVLDVGSLLAALGMDVLAGRVDAAIAAAAGDGVCEGYRTTGGCLDPAGLATAHAAGLLRRIGEPFKVRDPDWDVTASAMLDAVADVIRGAGIADVISSQRATKLSPRQVAS